MFEKFDEREAGIALTDAEVAAVSGGSIYVDGVYWGEGTLGLSSHPGGFPEWNKWPDGTRTPH